MEKLATDIFALVAFSLTLGLMFIKTVICLMETVGDEEIMTSRMEKRKPR